MSSTDILWLYSNKRMSSPKTNTIQYTWNQSLYPLCPWKDFVMFVYISMWLLIDIEWVFGGKSKQF